MPTGENGSRHPSWSKRVAWLLAIWSASVLALAAFAYLLRLLMNAVGMTA